MTDKPVTKDALNAICQEIEEAIGLAWTIHHCVEVEDEHAHLVGALAVQASNLERIRNNLCLTINESKELSKDKNEDDKDETH